MFGFFGKPNGGLSTNERRAIQVRDDLYYDAQSVLGNGIRHSDGPEMSRGVRMMQKLIEDYPDFPKPYIRMIQFSL